MALYAAFGSSTVNFHDAAGRSGLLLAREWQPIYAFEVLGIEPPGLALARGLFAAILASIALGILGIFTRTSCAVAALLNFHWYGLAYSFEQVHHEKVALIFALLALPLSPCGARLSVDALLARVKRAARGGDPAWAPESSPFAGWAIRFTQVTIAIGYFFSGASKLAIAGIEWMNGYTLQAIMLGTEAPWAGLFSRSVALSAVLSAGLLLIQVTFPLVFLHPALRWIYVPGALIFHLAAWKTMGTGTFFTLWGTLVCFLPLEKVPSWLGRALTEGPLLRRAAAGLLLALATLGMLDLYFLKISRLFALLFLPLAAAGLFALLPGARVTLAFDGGRRACRRLAALVCALDWGHRVRLAELPPAAPGSGECAAGLSVADARGRAATGFEAWRVLAWRLPLLVWIAPLLSLVPLPVRARAPKAAG